MQWVLMTVNFNNIEVKQLEDGNISPLPSCSHRRPVVWQQHPQPCFKSPCHVPPRFSLSSYATLDATVDAY